ncbi:deoxyhypusine monooxygenase [Malassezia yamatoensis]|uniref:Deoxyhypusine hydroxylase n=1 Tax=Malassezia yamatoensis TaxID=253288 RepID=A0AAJ5YUR3_9BASI|nr:deoxyhypusine monooxygenase [Malassezia yamatoensis]
MLPDLDGLKACLHNQAGDAKLDARFRALFTLKGLASLSEDRKERIIDIIGEGFNDDSALLKHEMAYVLGQIKDTYALGHLRRVLADEKEHAMVRHEAAEAMGAISSTEALPMLEKYLNDSDVSVRETCDLAIKKIQLDNSPEGQKEHILKEQRDKAHGDAIDAAARAAAPIDPAPAIVDVKDAKDTDHVYTLEHVPEFRTAFLNPELPLFDRYRAMFALRNTVQQAGKDAQIAAVGALVAGLRDPSALFRHEICFVFGELCHPASVAAMTKVLDDTNEHEMVRHEAAEALGGVLEDAENLDESQSEALLTLQRWAKDLEAPRVVRESCVVALDEMAYNNDPTQFQPMDSVVA